MTTAGAAGSLITAAAAELTAAGIASPQHDAEALLLWLLDVPRGRLDREQTVPAPITERFGELVRRRAAREPLQHLVGTAPFRYLELEVGPGVFIPRPETELVAGAAVDELTRLRTAGVAPAAVDLGTGSGAIALAMATEVPGVRVSAVELCSAALGYARRNIDRAGVQIDLRHGDMAVALRDLAGAVHVVAANPPYVPEGGADRLPPEVRDHEPAPALWSGPDGLDAIRVVLRVAAALLVPGGLLVCEHDDTHERVAAELCRAQGGWDQVQEHRDLAGRPRFLTARRRVGPGDSAAAGTMGL